MKSWQDFVFFSCLTVVIVFGVSVVTIGIVELKKKSDKRYMVTIKNTDTVHRNSRVIVGKTGVLYVEDAEGREYIYREGWKAVEEVK